MRRSMRIGLGIVTAALFALMVALPAFAQNRTGTCTTAVALNSSTQSLVFPFQDVSGGRHYFLLQCVGTNNCACAMATGAGAPTFTATTGTLIGSGGNSWIMIAQPQFAVPTGEVDCIGVGGTSEIVGCDW